MRILVITPRFHTNLYYQVNSLISSGHIVKVIAMYRGKSEFHERIPYVCVPPYPNPLSLPILVGGNKKIIRSKWALKIMFPRLITFIHEFSSFHPEIVLVKGYQDLLSTITVLLCNIYKIPVVLLVQTSKNHIFGSKRLLKSYLHFLDNFGVRWYITPFIRNKLIFNKLSVKNITYSPFVIPCVRFRKFWFRKNRFNIIMVGKIQERKDQLLLLNAINTLKKEYDIYLTIVGEKADTTYLKKIWTYINKHELCSRVTIKHDVPYSEMLAEYRKHDLFILPSHTEPAAYSLVEAMAAKLPVICSDDNGTQCYITEGRNGYIFHAKNKSHLIDCIKRILCNKRKIKNMGAYSFHMAQQNHSPNAFLTKFNKIIQFICLERKYYEIKQK